MQGYFFYKNRNRDQEDGGFGKSKFIEKLTFNTLIIRSKKKRLAADQRIIVCLLLCGFGFIACGSAGVTLSFLELSDFGPIRLVGFVFCACGLMILLLSVEICVRRRRLKRQVCSEDDDAAHYIDPELIPYGFGNFKDGVGPTDPFNAAPIVEPRRIILTSCDDIKDTMGLPKVNVIPATPDPKENCPSPKPKVELILQPKRLKEIK